jgi:glycosyltransferase involved in cell wall biosynthesis
MPYRNEIISKYKFDYPFFFYVGSLNERKNVHILIDAFAHISDKTDHHLVLVGDGSKHYKDRLNEQIIKKGLDHKISIFHKVPNDDLPALYQLANVFVYPSAYEGFGIPIIEALNSKTPVITSEGSCFKETAGPGAIYTKPGDFKALAEAMYELSIDDAKQKELSEDGWRHGQRFHTEKTTKAMISLYKSLIN